MTRSLLFPLLALAGLLAVAVGVAVGAAGLGPGEILRALIAGPPAAGGADAATIVWHVRLPRACLAWVVGAALALSGAVFQGLFRNPLADPFVIGVSGGASVGAVAAMTVPVWLSWETAGGTGGLVPLFAFAGGLVAVVAVYVLARGQGRAPVETLLLAGLAVGAFCSALTSLLLCFAPGGVQEMVLWLMGKWGDAAWGDVGIALPYVAVAAAVAIALSRDLNALALGEEQARQLGVDVERSQRLLLGAGTLAAAAAVAAVGLIGFVGLIVPHAVRRLAGADHRTVVPASALAGGAFLVLADAACRVVGGALGLPLGVATGLCGGPFFLYILRKSRAGEQPGN